MYVDAGLKLYVERGADETLPELLFISGSGGDLRNRPNQFDGPLAQAFRLLCYDQRGLGRSDIPPGDYSMADYADDAARLLDALDIQQIPVMGVSFGGMVAQEFVLRHPDRVGALVLACTSAGGAGAASYPLHELYNLQPRARAEAHLKVADTRHTDAWIAQHPDKWEQRIALSMRPAIQGAESDDETEDGNWKQLMARKGHDTFSRLHQIGAPTLLVGGEFDGIAPPANMRAIQQQIKGSQLHFFRGGHMFLVQDKEANPFIIQWLKGVIESG